MKDLFEKVNSEKSKLDKYKNNGLYIDISLSKKRIRNNPNNFSIKKEDVFILFTKLLYEITKSILNGLKEKLIDSQFQISRQNFRKSFP